MYHSEEHGPGFLVFLLDVVFHNFRKGAVASFVTLHNLSAFLVDYDNMVVFVDYLHAFVFSCLQRYD